MLDVCAHCACVWVREKECVGMFVPAFDCRIGGCGTPVMSPVLVWVYIV